jgi:hypothetical protein
MRWEVDVSHSVTKTFTVDADSREEAEEKAIAQLSNVKNLGDGWVSQQEFDAHGFSHDEIAAEGYGMGFVLPPDHPDSNYYRGPVTP